MLSAYELLGIKFHSVTMKQALDQLRSFVDGDTVRLVVTVGPEMVMRAQTNSEFRGLVNGADLVVADGAGILWAASRCNHPLPERVAGIDLAVNFAGEMAERGTRLYLLGAAPGVAQKAAETLQARFPKLKIVGVHDGYFSDSEAMSTEIAQARPEVIFVGMGSPAQEKFVRTYGKKMGIKVGIGVGGSFDVLSGLKKRAPQWMIKAHLEWLYRFLSEPSRCGRMLAIPKYMWKVILSGRNCVRPMRDI